jgi:hypothetical protein
MSVVGHAPSLLDQGADPSERPSLSRESCLHRPQLKSIEDLDPLLRRQAGRASGLGAAPEGIAAEAARTHPLGPVADRPGRDAHAASDLGLGQLACLEKPTSLQAAFFLLLDGQFPGLPHATAL